MVNQIPDYRQRRVISPMKIFPDYGHARPAGGPLQHSEYGFGHDDDRLSRSGPARESPVRHQGGQHWNVRRQAGVFGCGAIARQLQQHLGDGT